MGAPSVGPGSFILCGPRRRASLAASLAQAVFDKFDRSHASKITARDLRVFLGRELHDEDIEKMMMEAGLQNGGR